MKKPSGWFTASREGLRMVLERRAGASGGGESGFPAIAFVLFELYQNADDTNAKRIAMTLKRSAPGSRYCDLTVEDDDPEGFVDLAHAYTLFAESTKKADATKAGRFDVGEKFVLAFCEEAELETTKGTVYFADTGERWESTKNKRAKGSKFWGRIRMTDEDLKATSAAAKSLLVRPGLEVTFNGEPLPGRVPLGTGENDPIRGPFEVTLTTEIGAPGEPIRRSRRKTEIRIYNPVGGPDEAWLYELSVPVVRIDCPWDVQVMQRVPLGIERDTVSPSFLRELYAAVLNVTHSVLLGGDLTTSWAVDAAGEAATTADAVASVLDLTVGKQRVGADPSDRESERTAVANGHNVVQPNTIPKALRQKAKELGLLKPAGQVFPSPKPFSEPGAPKLVTLTHGDQTVHMHRFVRFVLELGPKLLDRDLRCVLANDMGMKYDAVYSRESWLPRSMSRIVTFNVARLGKAWFEKDPLDPEVTSLLLHEFGHEFGDHLEHSYHEGLCQLGAKLAWLVATEPAWFDDLRRVR